MENAPPHQATITVNGYLYKNPNYDPLMYLLHELRTGPYAKKITPSNIKSNPANVAQIQNFNKVIRQTANTLTPKTESAAEKIYRSNEERRTAAINKLGENAARKLREQGY